ncbi:MAG: chorismate synthase [Bacteroidales bacterium]|jgi:chorismate synthase|nr:chorismate synthase [Bacteroidales bacterium]
MAGNSFGNLFRISTFGESHGEAIGGMLDGCPPNIVVDYELIQQQLLLRQNDPLNVNRRKESDSVKFVSGVFKGKTTGAPIAFIIQNKDTKPEDYIQESTVLKPSHGHFSYWKKYNIYDYHGGGRASARETACRVVCGCFAMMFLKQYNIHIEAFTTQIGSVKLKDHFCSYDPTEAKKNALHCPDNTTAQEMFGVLNEIAVSKDSIGCVIGCLVDKVPAGLGEPVFDKFSANLAKAMLSIPAAKGFEYGSGFLSASKRGSEINDLFTHNFRTKTNFSGGIQAGISNGNPVYFSVPFKPVPSIMQKQPSIDLDGNLCVLEATGRHDICVSPRVIPVVEAMTAITVVNHLLSYNAYKTSLKQ